MEGDAGTRRLNPTDADPTPGESLAVSPADQTEQTTGSEETTESSDTRRPPRLGVGWVATISVVLVLLAAGVATGGVQALRSHEQSAAVARNEAAALQAAKDCVVATHAPDTATMTVAQSKIIECSTGDFGAQASLYSGVLVDAYRAAEVTVQVSDMRAAVEKRNADGSFEVLVAVRVQVTNTEAAGQEQGYRLRVQMAPDEGRYKVARLDQVTS